MENISDTTVQQFVYQSLLERLAIEYFKILAEEIQEIPEIILAEEIQEIPEIILAEEILESVAETEVQEIVEKENLNVVKIPLCSMSFMGALSKYEQKEVRRLVDIITCKDCQQIYQCGCDKVEKTFEETVRKWNDPVNFQIEECSSEQFAEVTRTPFVDMYTYIDHKQQYLVVVQKDRVCRFVMDQLLHLVPEEPQQLDSSSFEYTDKNGEQAVQVVKNPVKKYSGNWKKERIDKDKKNAVDRYMVLGAMGNAAISKLIHDYNITFKLPDYTYVVYDIETVSINDSFRTIPLSKWSESRIVTIQVQIIKSDGSIQKMIFLNDMNGYTYDAKSKDLEGVRIIHEKSEQEICRQFMALLGSLGFVIAMGYNACGNIFAGNNALDSSKMDNSGYDLPFIIKRSFNSWQPIYQGFRCKYLGQGVKDNEGHIKMANQITRIQQLPKVLFVECMRVITDILLQNKSIACGQLDLKSICKAFKIETNKYDIDFREQQILLNTGGANLTDFLSYGIQDCVALWALMSSPQVSTIQNNLCISEQWFVPVQWTMHSTQASQLEHFIKKQYRDAGYLVRYQPEDQEFSMKGGYTDATPGFFNSVAQFDFVSMYPSIIRHFNISPENLTNVIDDESAEFCIEDDNNIPYRLKRTPGIFDKLVGSLFEQRIKHKNACKGLSKKSPDFIYHDKMQYVMKIGINTAFGLMCSTTSCLFMQPMGIIITGMGRKIIQETKAIVEARGMQVIACDTDAVNFCLPETCKNDEDLKIILEEINGQIAEKYKRKDKQNCLILTYEEIVERIFIISKKSYIWIAHNDGNKDQWRHHSQREGGPTGTMKTRGVVFRSLSDQGIKNLTSMIDKFMADQPEDVLKWFNGLQDKVIKDLQTIVAERAKGTFREDLQQYTIRYKNTQGSVIMQAIRAKYPEKDENKSVGEYNILYEKSMSRRVADMVIPVERVTNPTTLNLEKIATMYLSKFFKIINQSLSSEQRKSVSSHYKELMFELEDNMEDWEVMIRTECVRTGQKKRVHQVSLINRDDIFAMTKNSIGLSLHEIITQDTIRLTFDVDNVEYEDDIYKIITAIKESIMRFSGVTPQILVLKNSTKLAYHIYTNIEVSLAFAKIIVQDVETIGLIKPGVLDQAIYRMYGSLRLFNCIKISPTGIKDNDSKYNLHIDANPLHYMMTSLVDCIPISMGIHLQSTYGIDAHYMYSSMQYSTEEHSKLVGEYLNKINLKDFRIISASGFMTIKFNGKPKCPICNRNHDRIEMYAVTLGEIILLKCFGNREKSISIQIPKKEEEKSEGQSIVNRLKESLLLPVQALKTDKAPTNSQYLELPELVKDGIVFIKSGLGTGKTARIVELVAQEKKKTLLLSHRITFSNAQTVRYDGAVSYQGIKGNINFEEHNTIVCQIDSIGRVDRGCIPDILIIDEIESILSQMSNDICYKNNSFQRLCDLINASKRVIVMDGFLQQNTIDFIRQISQKNDIIFENVYKPYTHIPLTIFVTNSHNNVKSDVCSRIYKNTALGKKTVVMSLSRKLAQALQAQLETEKISSICIHGDNDKDQVDADGEKITHAKYKKIVLENIAAEIEKVSVFIYTGTLTAGVDIQVPVEEIIVIARHESTDAFQTVQGTYRFRDMQRITVYMPNFQKYSNEAPINRYPSAYRSVLRKHPQEQYSIWSKARKQTMAANMQQILVKQYAQMGHVIEFAELKTPENLITLPKIGDGIPSFIQVTEADIKAWNYHKEMREMEYSEDTMNRIRVVAQLRSIGMTDEQITNAHRYYNQISQETDIQKKSIEIHKYLKQHGGDIKKFLQCNRLGNIEERHEANIQSILKDNVWDTKLPITEYNAIARIQTIANLSPDIPDEGISFDDTAFDRVKEACQNSEGQKMVEIKAAYIVKGWILETKRMQIRGVRQQVITKTKLITLID